MPVRRSRHRRLEADDATAAALRRLARVAGEPAARPVEVPEPEPLRRGWRDALTDRLPLGLRGATFAATGRAAVALVTVLVLAVLATVLLVWLTRPQATALPRVQRTGGVPVGVAASASGFPPVGVRESASPSGTVVVHVAGAVHRPGLVTLPAGSRVAAAVDAAGGATRRADLASVNLARLLVDGEQLLVLRRNQVASGSPSGPTAPLASGGAAASGPVDLNSATLEQLDGLPGIGPVLAQRILDWRTAHGRFGSVDELSEVSGIGEKTLADLRPAVTV